MATGIDELVSYIPKASRFWEADEQHVIVLSREAFVTSPIPPSSHSFPTIKFTIVEILLSPTGKALSRRVPHISVQPNDIIMVINFDKYLLRAVRDSQERVSRCMTY